jgi:tRNA (adenine57-N1/adenine58-N1)-methyltransferase
MSDERRQNRAVVKDGEQVLLYIDRRRSRVVEAGKGTYETDKGSINLSEVVGLEYGTAVKTSTGTEARVMRPLLLDFLMRGFKRATQVIYPKDLGFIVLLSGIGPGSRVLEAGVGTGFLTATLAHFVGDNGHVYGYEIRKDFANVARRNLELAGLSHRVTIKIRDVKEGVDESGLNAAFLDLPDPWGVLPILREALVPTSPVIVFLPTTNQVSKFLQAVKAGRYGIDVHVYETLVREYQPKADALRPESFMVGHTGYIVFLRVI